MFERIDALIGYENRLKLESTTVALIGLGGVGGTAFECLIRSGIGHIIVVDKDKFEESNLNRQVLCTIDNIGLLKVDVAIKYAKNINKNIDIKGYNICIDNTNLDILDGVDYIIDAIDDCNAKIALIKYANTNNIKIISSVGTGKRLDPSKVYITTLDKTELDPLARVLRHKLRQEDIDLKIPVVASIEAPINKDTQISSMIFVPSTAGVMLSNWVVQDIINKSINQF